jgi:FtsP/CotA-like multicopper oxidase with cupredoxin domain
MYIYPAAPRAIRWGLFCALLGACAAPSPPATTPDAGGGVGDDHDGGAGEALPPSPPGQPPGWADQLRPSEPPDLNPDPHVLEVNLEAKVTPLSIYPGTTSNIWTYNGSLPGPLLHVPAGDRLIVHFTNNLPAATTIHWHGLRIPPEMDGVPDHPTPAVAPGATFRYDFVVPDAGLFWYHPHQQSAAQVGNGLYGTLLVDDPSEPAGLGDDVVMVLSDMDLLPDGTLQPPDVGGNVATLFGREGMTILVNGKLKPTLGARVGQRQRWRIVNAAKSRYFQLAAAGQKFLRIGGDGGRIPQPVEIERPVVIPGERLDLIWDPQGTPGSTIPVRWVPYDRGYGSTFMRPEVEIMQLALSPQSPVTPASVPALARSIAPLELAGATPISIRLTRNDIDKKFYLGINGKPFGGDDHIMAKLGETQIWTIENELDWAHPFHIHGFFHQVLDQTGAIRQPLEWKDTTDVPAKGKLKIAVKFDERPGMWMFHCHILDHADAGMMGMIMVEK